MHTRTAIWQASLLFGIVVCHFLADHGHAQAPAVFASDLPITLGQTMQNDATLHDVTFVDRALGWAVGDRGVIWHTSNGGLSWHLQASGVTCPLATVSFVDAQHGWAAGAATQPYSHTSRGVLLTTNDGGATWTAVVHSTLPNLQRIRFFDILHGIAAGGGNPLFPAGVFATDDGGKTWQPLASDISGNWLTADFLSDDTGAVAGAGGTSGTLMRRRVVRSPVAISSSRAFRALRLTPPTGGWLVGDGGIVLTTSDLGHTWQTPPGELPQFVRTNFDFLALDLAGQNVWVAGSPGSRIFHSPDAGHTWQSYATAHHLPLRAIHFVDATTGFAVGDLGSILATNDGGHTWQIQRRGGQRAALLLAFAREHDLPLELIGKLGAEEGYLTAVSLLHPAIAATDSRSHEALLLAGATSTKFAGQFSLAYRDDSLTPAELLAQLNRATDGRAVEQLNRHLVRELRIWRPEVVVTHPSEPVSTSPLASLVEQLVVQAIELAADPNQFPDLTTDIGLEPWQVKRVFGLLPTGSTGDVRIATGQFAPRLGTTLADWAEPPRRLLSTESTAAPEMIELQQIELPALANSSASHDNPHDLFAGLRLVPGGDARRRLANLPEGDIEQLRRLAARRRQMRTLVERTQGNAAWAGQVQHLIDGLDPATAGQLLFELAAGYRAAGQLDLAADTYSSLARRLPEHPLVEPALVWLVQFYASGEAAHRLADRAANNYRQASTPPPTASAIQQANAALRVDGEPVLGLARETRLERAVTLGHYLESARPAMYAEPSIRFPLVVAQRERGFANPAQRYFLSLRALPENDPWRRCARTEEWFAKSDGLPPPKTLGTCRRTAEPPQLDGQLDDPLWQSADRLQLKRGRESFLADNAADTHHTTSRKDSCPLLVSEGSFSYDHEFLYLVVRCPQASGVDYTPDSRPRPRDADLTNHDRLCLRLDVDRDYTTAYELTIDHRGWTHDACWNDPTWNPTWYVATAVDDTTWTIEAAIPLAELTSEPPTTRHVWAAAIERIIPRTGNETWSGDTTSADSPDHFGLLIFE